MWPWQRSKVVKGKHAEKFSQIWDMEVLDKKPILLETRKEYNPVAAKKPNPKTNKHLFQRRFTTYYFGVHLGQPLSDLKQLYYFILFYFCFFLFGVLTSLLTLYRSYPDG